MTTATYEEHLRENRRGALLRLVQIPVAERHRGVILALLHAKGESFSLSESAIKEGLAARGYRVPYDVVRDDLSWLQDASLVRISESMPGLWMATLARAGEDWADGSSAVPGVSRETRTELELQRGLKRFGFEVAADVVRIDLAWLREHGLIATEEGDDGWLARTTVRGTDFAEGRTRVPGVSRPRPT